MTAQKTEQHPVPCSWARCILIVLGLLVAIATAGLSYVSDIEKRSEARYTGNRALISQQAEALAEVRTDVKWIRQTLERGDKGK